MEMSQESYDTFLWYRVLAVLKIRISLQFLPDSVSVCCSGIQNSSAASFETCFIGNIRKYSCHACTHYEDSTLPHLASVFCEMHYHGQFMDFPHKRL